MDFNLFQLDMGSFSCVEMDHNKISLMGLAADVSKLPKTDWVATGSSAYCLDTGELYIYLQKNRTWYKQ